MPRSARVVVPGGAHHVTQRGSRRMQVFFSAGDYNRYRSLLSSQSDRYGVRVGLYCLMPNHVHLIAIPETRTSLSRALGEAHRLYACTVNRREGWSGHLWQERFRSFPMDERHLLSAIRYVLLNPVRAGLVERPEEWPYSSARFLRDGIPDRLTSSNALGSVVEDWNSFLDLPNVEETADLIRKHSSTGRPLGSGYFQEQCSRASRCEN